MKTAYTMIFLGSGKYSVWEGCLVNQPWPILALKKRKKKDYYESDFKEKIDQIISNSVFWQKGRRVGTGNNI